MTAPPDPRLAAVATWEPVAAAGYLDSDGAHSCGPADAAFAWASVTKLVTALAVWVAVEEETVSWDDPTGPPGATLRHLLAHASGLAPDSDDVIGPPGRRRVYSNRGFEVAAAHVAGAAGIDFADYATEAVLGPLGMDGTRLASSPASGATGPLSDLLRLAAELARPTLVSGATWRDGVTPAFPGLPGVLPGFGAQADNAWGLGVEIRDHKSPHWTGRLNSPRTFGHFGRSGSFLWVDPDAGVAAASLADRDFGPWAAAAWPALADSILSGRAG